jgi:hypothetical protein
MFEKEAYFSILVTIDRVNNLVASPSPENSECGELWGRNQRLFLDASSLQLL